MSNLAQRASAAAAAAKQQLQKLPTVDVAKGASLSAGSVLDRAASHPQVQQVVQQAKAASDVATAHVDHHYQGVLRKNSHYVLGSGPSFFVNKNNVWRYALFTTLAECVLLRITDQPCMRLMSRRAVICDQAVFSGSVAL